MSRRTKGMAVLLTDSVAVDGGIWEREVER